MPLFVRIVLYGVVSGAAAMAIYLVLSSQARIAQTKTDIRAVRRRLLADETSGREAVTLTKRNFALSFQLLGQVLLPSLASVLPIIFFLAGLDARHALALADAEVRWTPPEVALTIETADSVLSGQASIALPLPVAGGIRITDGRGGAVYDAPAQGWPVAYVHKRRWWNALLENEAGYLATSAPVDEVEFGFPRKTVIGVSPDWLGTWEAMYFVSLIVTTLGLKFGFKIE